MKVITATMPTGSPAAKHTSQETRIPNVLTPLSSKEIAMITRFKKLIREWPRLKESNPNPNDKERQQRYLEVSPGDDEDTDGLVQIALENMVPRLQKTKDPKTLAHILSTRYAQGYPESEALKLCSYVRCRELEREVKPLVKTAETDYDLLDCVDTKCLASELLQPEHKGAEFDEYTSAGLMPFVGEDTATYEFRASVYLLSDMLYDRQQVLMEQY